jgi:CTP synthase (UTP-ammonia lyase)
MMPILNVGLVGDYDESVRAHLAISKALAAAAPFAECEARAAWLPTPRVTPDALAAFDAIWCVPGSPYASMDGALAAIRHARERRVPFVGTCGGFQHAVIEYARHVAGMPDADHEESSPDAKTRLVTRLACSLVKVKAAITLVPGSRIAAAYGKADAVEEYQCNFGVNEAHRATLERAGLRFIAHDKDGDVRAMELPAHPFFVATLFQFELSALEPEPAPHPLAVAFLRAVRDARR